MGFRFRKRIKLFPGLWFNVSKSGVSTSIGGKGLTVNLKDGKVRATASIPGTGISYSETTRATPRQDEAQDTSGWAITPLFWVLVIMAVIAAVMMR